MAVEYIETFVCLNHLRQLARFPYWFRSSHLLLPAQTRIQVQRCQPALWRGKQIARTAAPVWVPHIAQHEIGSITEEEIAGERTAGRHYAPRVRAAG